LPANAMTNRSSVVSGQRMYHLKLNKGTRPLLAPGGGKQPRVRRHSGIKKIRLDFNAHQIKVFFFLSEIRAQHLAVGLRKQNHIAWPVTNIKRIMERGISPTLSGLRPKHIQIIGGLPPDQALGGALQRIPNTVRQALTRALEGWLITGLHEQLKQNPQSFITASEDPADGITIIFTIGHIPGFAQVRDMLKGKTPAPSGFSFHGKPNIHVTVVTGFKRD
jgi:hypothetical protein